MNLYGINNESDDNESNNLKNRKLVGFAIIGCIVLLVLLLVLIVYMGFLESRKLRLYINDTKIDISSELFKFDNSGNIEYISIKELAKLTNYDYFNGKYGEYTEDKDSCYIQNDYEAVSFAIDSDVVKKYIFNKSLEIIDQKNDNSNNSEKISNNDEYKTIEVFSIDKPIVMINDNLYVSKDLANDFFNIYIQKDKNKLKIYTLDKLVSIYNESVKKAGYDGLSQKYVNFRSIVDGKLIVTETGKYAVLDANNYTEIVGKKYDNLQYIQGTGEYIVEVNGNVGLLSSNGETKITPIEKYESIEIFDIKNQLYLVSQSGKYGVLSADGKTIVPVEFDKVGIDNFTGLDNTRVLLDNIIPVYKKTKLNTTIKDSQNVDNKENYKESWDFYTIAGNKIQNIACEGIGYIKQNTDSSDVRNTAIIPESVLGYDGIIIEKDSKYGIMDKNGNVKITMQLTKLYSEKKYGQTEYYAEYNGQKMTIQQLKQMYNI